MKFRYIGLGVSIGVSLAALVAVGSYQKETILRPLDLDGGVEAVAVPFLLAADGDLKLQVEAAREIRAEEARVPVPQTSSPEESGPAETNPPETKPVETAPPVTEPPETRPPETEPPETTPPETTPPETVPTETTPPETVPADSGPGGEELPFTPGTAGVFEPGPMVDESWFDDALFIGDSRTDGLRLFSRVGKADYFCSTGLSVYKVLKTECSDKNFENQKLESLLDSRTYGKILICLGINECGGRLDAYVRAYGQLLDTVRAKQPNAVIILQAIMTCSPKKEAQNACFSPANIYQRNEAIRTFADGQTVFYIDVNTLFAGEDGYLPDSFSSDGCHLYAKYYPLWVDWMRCQVYDIPLKGQE